MIKGERLAWMYETTYRTFKLNMRSISDEESRQRPEPAGNSINWLVGHLLLTRVMMLSFTPFEEKKLGEGLEIYNRGADAAYSPDELMSLDELKERFATTQEKLQEWMHGLKEEELKVQVREDNTLEERLLFLNFHESYHVGQIGLLRRLVGRPGAIK
ncbi:DinB family protein [bacterium]|nr:DinB family protein [bacterium]